MTLSQNNICNSDWVMPDRTTFNQSIVNMYNELRQRCFNDSKQFKFKYFITGEQAAFKILYGWLKQQRMGIDVYQTVNSETYFDICMLLDVETTADERIVFGMYLLDKTIPDNLTQLEEQLFSFMYVVLDFYHFEKGEELEDDYILPMDKQSLLFLYAEIWEIMLSDEPEAEKARRLIESLKLPSKHLQTLEER